MHNHLFVLKNLQSLHFVKEIIRHQTSSLRTNEFGTFTPSTALSKRTEELSVVGGDAWSGTEEQVTSFASRSVCSYCERGIRDHLKAVATENGELHGKTCPNSWSQPRRNGTKHEIRNLKTVIHSDYCVWRLNHDPVERFFKISISYSYFFWQLFETVKNRKVQEAFYLLSEWRAKLGG